MSDTVTITLGDRTFTLDREKAEEAYAAKKVLNGRNSMFFNILPLKYNWAYDLYREMKNSHWEPGEIAMTADTANWSQLSAPCQTLVKTTLGVMGKSQDIFHSEGIYTIRDLVTAPELKLVFGRFVHEENTRNDILVHLYSALGINPMECAQLAISPQITLQEAFFSESLSPVSRNTDTTVTENKQSIARNIFLINQCGEGTQFASLYAVIFSLAAQNKLPGTGKVLTKFQKDIHFRISLFDKLIADMVSENADVWTDSFKDELVSLMTTAVENEKALVVSLPTAEAGLDPDELSKFIEFLADERLSDCKLPRQFHTNNPFPWLEANFHITSSPQPAVSSSATLDTTFDDDDL